MTEEQLDELSVDEPDCAEHVDTGDAPPEDPEHALSAEDEAALEAAESDDTWVDLFAGGLGPRGGGWGGAQAPVNRAQAIGVRNGLRVTSRKRSSGSSGSDHHVTQRRSDAVDLSNGSSPTPQMDRTASRIAALLGVPGWRGGVLNRRMNGYRVQLIYRTNVGGNHFNHVHVGVRVGG